MSKLKCKRCGHSWIPRVVNKPVQCPKCKSYKWDIEKDGKRRQII